MAKVTGNQGPPTATATGRKSPARNGDRAVKAQIAVQVDSSAFVPDPVAEQPRALGWLRDLPSIKDYAPDNPEVAEQLDRTQLRAFIKAPQLPARVDLRPYCSPIENQGDLGSCTAHAGVGLMEYFQTRAFSRHLDGSRLFIYKVTRNMMGVNGDTGAWLRTTAGAMVLFGVPPERYLPYRIATFDQEPSNFVYCYAQNFKMVKYYRLDTPGIAGQDLVARIKTYLAAGLPSMFGFSVYSSFRQAETTGCIPYPNSTESLEGGHAVVAVGYDDAKVIRNKRAGSPSTQGAFLIRNSWGTGWGEAGYGWLPYEYVLGRQADDWWSLISADWVDTGAFS